MPNAIPAAAAGHARISDSAAFRAAALRSESLRAVAVVLLACFIIVLAVLPHPGQRTDTGVRIIAIVGMCLLFLIQAVTLLMIRRARAVGGSLPPAFVVGSVVIEALLPTGIIWWNIQERTVSPYSALSSPSIVAYGMMITLTALRLRPALCVLAGAVAALSYAAVVHHVVRTLRVPEPAGGLPFAAYINIPVMVMLSGLAGAWVTREIRRHLDAALHEVELQHRVARIEHDLSIARSIQQALLPRAAPEIPGYDIAGWNQSADQTGGDYYDWQPLPDGNWLITLADVSGHGIGPALVTAACRAYARASSFYNANLAALASRMNRLLAEDLPEGRFVTMATVLIDAGGGPPQLLSAGHGPIVLYVGSTRDVRDIMPSNLPLAIVSDAEFGPAQPVTLAPGDVLALVTDGFVEWSRSGAGGQREQFGSARLRSSLTAHAHLPAAEIIRSVADDVAAFAQGEPQQDDLTMVVIKRC